MRVTHVTNHEVDLRSCTFNVVGGNQTNITTIYNVNPNCDKGIGSINHTTLNHPHRLSRQDLPVVSTVIPSTNYPGALNVRLKDTGLWFINGARFARWKGAADDFLGICGARMYSYHLRVIIDTELLWQLVPVHSLETNLRTIPFFVITVNNGSPAHRSSKTWLVIARLSTEGMAKEACN
jgi:hypothetical protein